jgi:hypothetical protein
MLPLFDALWLALNISHQVDRDLLQIVVFCLFNIICANANIHES